jgi:hypothetical protein
LLKILTLLPKPITGQPQPVIGGHIGTALLVKQLLLGLGLLSFSAGS